MDLAEATPDPSGKAFRFAGEQFDPQTNAKARFTWLIAVETKDKVKVEMFEQGPDGKEEKSLEISQTRVGN